MTRFFRTYRIIFAGMLFALMYMSGSFFVSAQGSSPLSPEHVGLGLAVPACISSDPTSPSCTAALTTQYTVTWNELSSQVSASCGSMADNSVFVQLFDNANNPIPGQGNSVAASCSGNKTFNFTATAGAVYRVKVVGTRSGFVYENQQFSAPDCTATAATATLSAAQVACGAGSQSVSVSWSSTNATSCTGGNFSTGGATSGSLTVTQSASTQYSLSCTGPTGTSPLTSKVVDQCVGGTAPDVTAGAVTFSPTSVTAGNAVVITSVISNLSTVTGISYPTTFYNLLQVASGSGGTGTIIEKNASFCGNACGVSGYVLKFASNPADHANQIFTYTFPSAGTYSVRVCADKGSSISPGTIPESNESNNCGAWVDKTVTVGATLLPDLAEWSGVGYVPLDGPSSPTENSYGGFYGYVKNVGNANVQDNGKTPTFYNFFQLSTGSGGLGTITDLSPLSATYSSYPQGAITQIEVDFKFPVAGSYSMRFCADKASAGDTGRIPESNESNNCGGWQNITIASDLCPSVGTGNGISVVGNNSASPTIYGSNGSYYVTPSSASDYATAAGRIAVQDGQAVIGQTITVNVLRNGKNHNYVGLTQNGITTLSNYYGTPTCSIKVQYPAQIPDITATYQSPSTAVALATTTLSASISTGGVSVPMPFFSFLQVATASGGGGTIMDLSPTGGFSGMGGILATGYAFPSTGTYSVRACGDKSGSTNAGLILETNEANNCSPWADVQVTSYDTCAATYPGEYGLAYVVGTTTGIVWGSGPYTRDSGVSTASVHRGLIAVGQTATILRTSTPISSSYVGSTANGVTSLSTNSSICGKNLSVDLSGKLPDLSALGTITPSSVGQDVATTITGTATNYSDVGVSTPFWNFFQVTPPSGPIIDLSPIRVTSLGSGATLNLTQSYNFPLAGTYQVRLCVDKKSSGDAGVINEGANEGNNCGAWVPVVSSSLPELTASAPTPSATTAGVSTTYYSLITNTGVASTGVGFNYYMRKTDTLGGAITDFPNSSMAALSGQSARTASYTYTFPSAGTFYVSFCADKSSAADLGVITEFNENNNCSAWTAVTVAAADTCVTSNPASYGTVVVTGTTLGSMLTGSNPYKVPLSAADTAEAATHAGLVAVGKVASIDRTSAGTVANFTGSTANGITTGSSGIAGCGVNLALSPSATLTLIPAQRRVQKNKTTTISWSAQRVNTCTLSGPSGFTPVTANGFGQNIGTTVIVTAPVTGVNTYTLSCTTNTGSATANTSIGMIPMIQER